jgi:hypothetical protein
MTDLKAVPEPREKFELETLNQRVVGSSPTAPTNNFKRLSDQDQTKSLHR